MIAKIRNAVDRHWLAIAILCWLGLGAFELLTHVAQIKSFWLADTDDNMRIAQVRAWLNHGQGWYDLRQHKLNAPAGANMHWSRLVDLPIAGLILLGRLFLSGPHAEMFAIALAPMIPLLLLVVALFLAVRRLVDPVAGPMGIVCLFFAGSGLGQYVPNRIDHHNWQLAFLMLGVAGIADPNRRRGGFVLGLAGALSLAIGLESIIYIALGGAAMVGFWLADRAERDRLAAYAATIAGGSALAFLVFASYDNRRPVCDALSPVWLSDALLGGALLLALAWWSPEKWKRRLTGAAGVALVMAAFHALVWPKCLSRLEGVSPQSYQLWLSHVREAMPVYRHGWRIALTVLALPTAGAIGWAILLWVRRGDPERLRRTAGAAAIFFAAAGLLFWQTRTGPAAQLLAIPGAAALVWLAVPWTIESRNVLVRVLGTSVVALFGLGALMPLIGDALVPETPMKARDRAINKANASCPTLPAMRPIAQLPPATIFTFGDLTPRMIAVTHHRGVIGPYHRNDQQIIDSMMFFRGDAENAHRLARKYHADYVMTCPMMSQSTIYSSEAPKGFYVQLERGRIPPWLRPVPLPKGSPLKLWRVVG